MTRHLLVVGAQRCGTTYLHDLLDAHPDIAMARPARPEPKVFLREDPPTAEAYRAEFFGHAGGAGLLGEKSTSYLESPDAPGRVADVLGSPQVLVQLRDPVDRAVSNWSFSRDHGVETRPLEAALLADLGGDRAGPPEWDRNASSVSPFAYVTRGRYVEDLARWTEHFDVRVQFLEELLEDEAVVDDLWRWLGVEAFHADLGAAPVNASGPSGPLDDALVTALREHYRDSDAALAEMLGRELPWRSRRDT